MRVVNELKTITNILSPEDRELINRITLSNFTEAEQEAILYEFREVIVDEMLYILTSKKSEKEIKKIMKEVRGS